MRKTPLTKNRPPRVLLAGRRLVWPAGVPRSARFEESGCDDTGIWGQFIHSRGRASISWSPEGNLFSERYFDAQGRAHGLEVSRHDDGTVQWRVPWVRGQMHGLARQFDEAGRELVRTRFIRGSGIGLWVSGGFITELREHENSQRHGVERWGHPLFPYEENHYLRGRQAGISRRWKGPTLEPGYPHYFVDDEEVSRAEYLRARKARPELPAYRRQDDRHERPMHDGLPHAWIRKDLRAHLMRMPTPEDGID